MLFVRKLICFVQLQGKDVLEPLDLYLNADTGREFGRFL